MTRVLFVCLGNICRSPAAEAVLRQLRPDWEIDSCGTGGWHVGDEPYGPMQDVARARGIDMGDLRARQLSERDFARFDLVVAMDAQNLAAIEAMGGEAVLLGAFDGSGAAVPDPYYTGDFDGALDMIQRCCAALVAAQG